MIFITYIKREILGDLTTDLEMRDLSFQYLDQVTSPLKCSREVITQHLPGHFRKLTFYSLHHCHLHFCTWHIAQWESFVLHCTWLFPFNLNVLVLVLPSTIYTVFQRAIVQRVEDNCHHFQMFSEWYNIQALYQLHFSPVSYICSQIY